MPQKARVEFVLVEPKSRAEWRRWLARNHSASPGAKLVLHKKNSDKPRMTYDEAVEEALCFGWIDSKPKTLDETRYILHLSPRRPGSVWSRRKKERIKRLIQTGLMTPSGLLKIEAARRDGSWQILDKVDKLEIPSNLNRALRASPRAREHFASFPNSSKKIILYWVLSAPRREPGESKRPSPGPQRTSGSTIIGNKSTAHKSPIPN